MEVPVQITYRDVDHSEALDERIHYKVKKLQETFDKITYCNVTIEKPSNSHTQGNLFSVHFGIHVPGKEIIVRRDHAEHAHEDVFIALKNSFEVARRQLKQHADKTHGRVKHHA